MPTQSDSPTIRQWTARTDTPKRSVFGNYRPAEAAQPQQADPACPPAPGEQTPLRNGVAKAVARSFIYRFLAKAFEDPSSETWNWLCNEETQNSLGAAWKLVIPGEPLVAVFRPEAFDDFHDAYLAAFGHAARGTCPLNEIEYGDIKADPLFQPHRLADLAAFYRAFGLELAEEAGERQDHLCLELEFLCVLAAKEAFALDHGMDSERIQICRNAQKQFLREHLGRWTPAFARRLAATTSDESLRALAEFTRVFVEHECARFGVTPGSQELTLRPPDEAADRMCDSCGINNLPPGALATT